MKITKTEVNINSDKEIWKDIENYENYYQISNFGRLRSLTRTIIRQGRPIIMKGKILSPPIARGYKVTKLCKNGTYIYKPIHILVAKYFVPNLNNKPEVNHIDGNKLNNYASNLEWVTRSENEQHAYDTGLEKMTNEIKYKIQQSNKMFNDNDILNILDLYYNQKLSMRKIAKMYNTYHPVISNIIKNKGYKNILEDDINENREC